MSSITVRRLDREATPLARRSGSERSRTIGVLILDPTPFARASLLSAIHAAARDADYLVSITDVPVAGRGPLLAALGRLRDRAAEGILVIAPRAGALEALSETAREIPVVAVGTGPHDGMSTVTVDHYGGAAVATRHLLALGNQTVFHVSGPAGQHDSNLRLAGWRDALLAAGAEVPLPLIGDWSPARGYELGCRLGLRTDVTAIFVSGDHMALGVLRALHELRRPVPDEVSVVGFDCIPEGEFFTPPLTTVRQNATEMGRRSFDLLSAEIELGRQATVHHTVPTELILRASTMTADRRREAAVVPV
jgi:DNA-binding LacI/PurR family transcriptional regulator